ncbi:restriction endonuclease subunit S [Sphingobium yanoikuyae]|uniref:restriction endonuclease subunit S n=1 Tax=Sphingobium yanoikuyae TaxID=13690 RepID=UPI0022DD5DBD|nr:restriction endonuclease subunit S [Sphingobium yanoikuyae]WBQ18976.1 restriction endonuclease subunit S [Sphingobium yanoikuyae]
MTELPQGWAETSLGELTEKLVDGSHNPPSKAETGLPMLSARNVMDGKINFDQYRFIDPDLFEMEHRRTRVTVGDVLLTIVGTIGRSAVVPEGLQDFTLQRSVAVMTPTPAVGSSYLSYFFSSADIQRWFEDNAKGTAQKGVYLGALAKLNVPVAPLPEQRRIVAKVDGLTTRTARARKELDRIPTLIARYKQRLLALAFSGELTAGWRRERGGEFGTEVTLGDVATGFNYGTAAKSTPSGDVPVLRMGNIQDGKLDWSNLVYTSDQTEIEKYRLAAGDVLFNRTNSPELVGKTALFNGEREAIYAGYLIRIRCRDVLLPAFLSYCLNAPDGRAYCWEVKTDGVSQSNINAKKIAAFRFVLPSIEEQAEIVRRIESAFDWLDRMAADHAAAARLLPKLEAAILAKAFRGELVPQDPNDEPASVLLEQLELRRQPLGDATKGRRGRKPKESKAQSMAVKPLAARERLLKDSEQWPAVGLPFEAIAMRNAMPHDALRDAMFELLSGPSPALQQRFDTDAEVMVIQRVPA